mmetsp:Transcript_4830/g.15306  ORF Transcript_4830/g.15306 Transcript_4830/m.15306 type:complete len:220 (-) Transcript_4830:172-831(-)
MIFSSAGSQDTAKWQFAKNTQLPCARPSLMSLVATGAWPWPSEQSPTLRPICSARAYTCLVGSTPGESTKMIGADGELVSKTSLRLKGGGSTNSDPMLLATKLVHAFRHRSTRSARTISMRCSSVSLLSHSPGNESCSGAELSIHLPHSRRFCSNDPAIPLKTDSLSSSVMLSHCVASSMSLAGFGFWLERSTTVPPRRRKSSSSFGSFPSCCIVLMAI